jgi:hypothetical protein
LNVKRGEPCAVVPRAATYDFRTSIGEQRLLCIFAPLSVGGHTTESGWQRVGVALSGALVISTNSLASSEYFECMDNAENSHSAQQTRDRASEALKNEQEQCARMRDASTVSFAGLFLRHRALLHFELALGHNADPHSCSLDRGQHCNHHAVVDRSRLSSVVRGCCSCHSGSKTREGHRLNGDPPPRQMESKQRFEMCTRLKSPWLQTRSTFSWRRFAQ